MIESITHNGMLYQIEYQPELSSNYYTTHKIFHIKTKEDSYSKARKDIAAVMAKLLGYNQKDIWDKGLWLIRNKNTPSMVNALHIYYEFTYNKELDVYVYTFVRPYDD